ncbi:MAG: sn-glycerol-3-phosphate ABC transporter ATP-binding protein UgpC [Rudaea sp.]
MSQVILDNVRKVYPGGVVAVDTASFSVADGELLVLVGPSGCGKTTTLRMIAGLESITSGTVSIGGRVVNDVAPKDRDIAMVFQNYALYPHMSVAENLAFGLKLRGEPRETIDKLIAEAAQLLGLDGVLKSLPRALSGGQRQRVALGRAMVRQPKVFLLDEPLSNLDAKLRLTVRAEIARLHRRLNATMVYVTHDQIEAMTLGQRIVVFNRGHIQQIDTPMNLYARPANLFVAGFIGSPGMNFFRGRLSREGGLHIDGDGLKLSLGSDVELARRLNSMVGGEIVAGLRPEDLHPVDVQSPSTPHIEAVVELVEPVGNETFINLRYGKQEIVARIPPRELPEPGSAMTLEYRTDAIHFFDAKSESRVC